MRRRWEVHEGRAKVLRGSNEGCVYKVFGENKKDYLRGAKDEYESGGSCGV